jgi:hypothetical protein
MDFQFVRQAILFKVMPRGKPEEVLGNGHIACVIVGGGVVYFVEELFHHVAILA